MSLSTIKVTLTLLKDPTQTYYGLELSKKAGVPIGSVYPILARLEDAGWLEGLDEEIDEVKEGRPARRFYRLTQTGLIEARQEVERHGLKVPRMRVRHV